MRKGESMKKYFVSSLLALIMLFSSFSAFSTSASDSNPSSPTAGTIPSNLPIEGFFTENKGQWDSSIYYTGNTSFGQIAFTAERLF